MARRPGPLVLLIEGCPRSGAWRSGRTGGSVALALSLARGRRGSSRHAEGL